MKLIENFVSSEPYFRIKTFRFSNFFLLVFFEFLSFFISLLKLRKMELILAIDQGTSSNRVLLFSKDAKIVAVDQREFQQIYPQPGWAGFDLFQFNLIFSLRTRSFNDFIER